MIKMAFCLCGLLAKKPITHSNHEKNIIQILTERHRTKYLTNPTENSQDHQKEGKYEKLF